MHTQTRRSPYLDSFLFNLAEGVKGVAAFVLSSLAILTLMVLSAQLGAHIVGTPVGVLPLVGYFWGLPTALGLAFAVLVGTPVSILAAHAQAWSLTLACGLFGAGAILGGAIGLLYGAGLATLL